MAFLHVSEIHVSNATEESSALDLLRDEEGSEYVDINATNATNSTSFRIKNGKESEKLENGGEGIYHDYHNNSVNISATMGYYNLSCPFAWQKNDEEHHSEIWRAFDSILNDPIEIDPPKPKRIFMTGDSLLRQVFISVACHAFSLNAVEHRRFSGERTLLVQRESQNVLKEGNIVDLTQHQFDLQMGWKYIMSLMGGLNPRPKQSVMFYRE